MINGSFPHLSIYGDVCYIKGQKNSQSSQNHTGGLKVSNLLKILNYLWYYYKNPINGVFLFFALPLIQFKESSILPSTPIVLIILVMVLSFWRRHSRKSYYEYMKGIPIYNKILKKLTPMDEVGDNRIWIYLNILAIAALILWKILNNINPQNKRGFFLCE